MPTTLANANQIDELLRGATDPGQDEAVTIDGMLPIVSPEDIASAGTLPTAMTDRDIKEVVLSLDSDPRARLDKWKQRWGDGRRRLSFYNTYHLLYRYAVDGLAHRFDVVGDPGETCSLEEATDENWLITGNEMDVNSVRPLVEEIASRLNFSGTVLKAYPRTSAQHDIASARIATSFARFLAGTEEWREFSNRSSMIGPIHGWACAKVEWDRFAYATTKTANGSTNCVRDGAPTLSVFAPYAILYSPGIAKLEEASWICDIEQHSWDWLLDRYPEKAMHLDPRACTSEDDFLRRDWLIGSDPLYNIAGWGMGNARNSLVASPYGFAGMGRPGEPMLIVNCYEKMHHPEWGPIVMKTVYCRGVELESYPLMSLFVDEATGQTMARLQPDGKPITYGMPYHVFKYYELPDVFEGRGVVRDVLSLSSRIAYLYELLMRNANDATNTFMFHGANDSMTPWYSKVFTLVKYQHKIPDVQKLSPQFQELIFLINKLEDKMYQIALLPDVKRGILPGSGTSGRALETLAAQADGGFGNIRQRKARFDAEVITAYLRQMQDNASLARVFQGVGKNDGTGSLVFRGADLAGMLDVRASLEGELPADPVSRASFAQALLNTGALQDPDDVWDLVKPGGSFEEIDSPGRSDALAMQFIGNILSLPEDEAAMIHSLIVDDMRGASDEAMLTGADPEAAAAQARVDGLAHFDLGIEPQFDAKRQARKTRAWLNDLEALTVAKAHKALIIERFNALETAALGGPVSAPPVPQPRSLPSPQPVAPQVDGPPPEAMTPPGSRKATRQVTVQRITRDSANADSGEISA